jgi:hypothetical protein
MLQKRKRPGQTWLILRLAPQKEKVYKVSIGFAKRSSFPVEGFESWTGARPWRNFLIIF